MHWLSSLVGLRPRSSSEELRGERSAWPFFRRVDLEAARRAKLFIDAGLPKEGVLETSRIIGISMASLADANRDMVGEVFERLGHGGSVGSQ